MCHLYPYKNVKLLWEFFTLIFAFLLVGTIFLYETRFKVKLPTSNSTEITGGGPKVTLEGSVPLDAPGENTFVLDVSTLPYRIVFSFNFFGSSSIQYIMGSKNYIRGPCATWTLLAVKCFIPKWSISQYLIAFLILTF